MNKTKAPTKATIPYNKPLVTGKELEYLSEVFAGGNLTGGGPFTKRCMDRIGDLAPGSQVYLTTSGTSALEFAVMLAGIKPGDEVVVPSYTYVSTANAFMIHGATLVYIDVDPRTMCLDAALIEPAITERTRAIVPVHYASIPADINSILALARKWPNVLVIEDAATCLFATSSNKALGSIGHIGCYSFHETKNYSAGGQGGCILVNDPSLFARAETIYENGTNRRAFARREVFAYDWRGHGSNFYMSETAAACLWAALEAAETVTPRRREIWAMFMSHLETSPAVHAGKLQLPHVPAHTIHNGHLFWVKTENKATRDSLIQAFREEGIVAMFHFTPLHSSPAGRATGRMSGQDVYTTNGSNCIVRLPIYYGLSNEDVEKILNVVDRFYEGQD